jgi:hypothetical protein
MAQPKSLRGHEHPEHIPRQDGVSIW